MEGALRESGQASPIATTPPHQEPREELLSRSSSGTHTSNASGVSLGEVIRRRSEINRGMAAWYQPCTEVDTSNLTVAKGEGLGRTRASDMTEFPTLEEGLVTPREISRRQQAPNVTHTPMLEIQDSCLSPNLPLMTTYSTQGPTFFGESIFPETEMDFAALRGTPDTSDTASEDTSRRLHGSEAVRLAATEVSSDCSGDCNSLSQHPLAFSTLAPSNASLSSCLSQHPLSISGHPAVEQGQRGEEPGPQDGNAGVGGSPKLLNEHRPSACPPPEVGSRGASQDLFLLDSRVPAPLLLEMLEKEMGLAKDGGFSSSDSSSSKSISGKAPEENERSRLIESAVLVAREPETFVEPPQQEETVLHGPASFRLLSDTEGEPMRYSKDLEQLSANSLQAQISSKGRGIGFGDSSSVTRTSGRRNVNRQQASEASFEECKRNLVSALADCRLHAPVPLQPAWAAPVGGSPRTRQASSVVEETQAGVTRKELTLSDYSIEREHKDTGVSPSFHEGSFFGLLAHPIHHSTPGVFTARNLKEDVPGVAAQAKPILPSPLACVHEELLKASFASTQVPSVEEPRGPSGDDSCVPSAEEPLVLQSRHEVDTGSSSALGALHPLKGRIQSLPCLNFMEKVGAWSTSQSAERMSDALALHASSGVSPRRKTYSALADSMNSIFPKQKNQADLKTWLAASCCGPASTTSRHACHKEPPGMLPLARSHSENSVVAVGREALKADDCPQANPDDDHQPEEGKGRDSEASGMKQDDADTEDPLLQRRAAALVSAVSSDEETIETAGIGRNSNPDHLITSDRVAELLKEANSLSGSQEMSDGSQDNGRERLGFHLGTNQIKMDSFRDVSPDSLNQLTGSGAGSCADLRLPSRQSSRRSSPLSGKHPRGLEDVPKTPDDGGINIEERIPVYLRNLGIDQSPSSILTPFMRRGPIREIELSPTEPRSLEASADSFTLRLQLSEGDSQSVIDAMQSSACSSTVPGGLDPASAVPLPAEASPQTSRASVSELSPVCGPLPAPVPPHPAEGMSKISAAAPASPEQSWTLAGAPSDSPSDGEKSTEWEQAQMGTGHASEVGPSREKLPFSSIPKEKDGKGLSGRASSLSTIPEGEKDDYFIGPRMLKEIGKRQGEAETRTPARSLTSASSVSSVDLGSSSKQRGRMGGSQDSRFVKGGSLGIQRIWSWDESLAGQDFQGDKGLSKTLSLSGTLKWGELLPADVGSREPIGTEKQRATFQVAGERHKAEDPMRRSEPEGCNSASVNKNRPVFVRSGAGGRLRASEDLKESQATSSVKPSDEVSHSVGNQRALEKAKEGGRKELGSSQGSGNGSSVDSLGIRVKTLLQLDRPTTEAPPWVGEQKPGSSGASSAFSRGDVVAQQSDNSSSLDSLAARVRVLLEEERPVMHAAQILQRAEEDEKKAHAWVKLKLDACPPGSVPDLNEEDQQKIEEIKRQHCLSARKAGVLKNQLRQDGSQRISNHRLVPELNTGLSDVPRQNDLQNTLSTQNSHVVVECPELNEVQAGPAYGAGSPFPIDPELSSLAGVQSHASQQLRAPSGNVLCSRPSFHTPLCSATDVHLTKPTSSAREIGGEERNALAQEKLTVDSSSTEPAKQITSITFTSRKRLYSLPASSAPCPGLTEAKPCHLETFKTQSVTNEKPKPRRQQPETSKLPPSLSPTVHPMPDRNVGYSSGEHDRPNVTPEESHPKDGMASQGKPPASWVEPEVLFATETRGEIQAMQALPDGRRHNKSLGVASANQPDGKRTMADPVNPSLQKTDQACLQDKAGSGSGSVGREPFFLTGKERTTTKSKLTFDSHLSDVGGTGAGRLIPLPPASPDCFTLAAPVSPSSPTKKALSGVHITLSPKRVDFDRSSPLDAGLDARLASGLTMSSKPATFNAPPCEATSRLRPPKTQDLSRLARPLASPDSHVRHSPVSGTAKLVSHGSEEGRASFPAREEGKAKALISGGLEESAKTTVASQTQRMSSDAVTQITTESPERTTYSAEIFVSTEADAPGLLPQNREQFSSTATPTVNQASVLEGQTGMPVLLPYKPPGSSEMYYVPCPKEALRLFRVGSETTVESSHPGSNDALPPEFPPQLLGSWEENPPSAVAVKHREGVYSMRTMPRNAWTEEKMPAQKTIEESTQSGNHVESVKTTNSDFRSAQFYLHRPGSRQHEIDHLRGNEVPGQAVLPGYLAVTAKDIFQNKGRVERSQAPPPLDQSKGDDEFSPLTPELDYSFLGELNLDRTSQRESPRKEKSLPDVRKTGHEVGREQPLPSCPKISLQEKQGADRLGMQGARLTGSLDELWAKFLERQKHPSLQNPSGNRKELSLVERLDRLARLLHNPVRRSPPAQEEPSCVREQATGKEPPKISFQGEMAYRMELAFCSQGEGSPDAISGPWLSEPRHRSTEGATTVEHVDGDSEQLQDSETPSDTSSEVRPVKDASVFTEVSSGSEATQLETERASRTEASGSVSTIDTARLIRAFGHSRVQVSPKLSLLYGVINHQKTRSEKQGKRSRKSRGADCPKTTCSEHKMKDSPATDSVVSSDSVSTASGSRGPSSALSHKRSARMLNKAVQAGDFEIVNSATKRHTRDVGLTFPTPASSRARLRGDHGSDTEEEPGRLDGRLSEGTGQQKRQPGGFLAEKRPRRNQPQGLQGVSWFVPADDGKPEPKRGNGSSPPPEPGPSWFEPLLLTRPWREPLREKNWQEDPRGALQERRAAPRRDGENQPPPPFANVTLQEALVLHRPDFISSSGERVKRLKLIIEERRLQSLLQGEREELFNPLDERRNDRIGNRVPSTRDYRTIRRKRAISKSEMVQRSKRIYEQLPEVRKRKEEEKRKSDYSTNRLKAQLYKTKITNHILGRKVPWE